MLKECIFIAYLSREKCYTFMNAFIIGNSILIEEHKNNPRYLFHTVASLTKSHASADTCIPATDSSNDFMNFSDTKLIKIRETIQNLSSASAPSMASPDSDRVDMSFRPAICLDSFTPIKLNKFCSLISSSKNSTCLLDPLPTGFLKQMLPEIWYTTT